MLNRIVCSNVSYSYLNTPILSRLNISLSCSSFVILAGGCSSGKTTVAKLLTKQIAPTSGNIDFFTENIASDLVKTVIPHLSTLHNLLIPIKIRNDNYKTYVPRCMELLAMSGLPADTRPASTLSSGQSYILEIAQKIIIKPDVLILDNPFHYLDEEYSSTLGELLTQLNQAGVAILCTTFLKEQVCKYVKTTMYETYEISPTSTNLRSQYA